MQHLRRDPEFLFFAAMVGLALFTASLGAVVMFGSATWPTYSSFSRSAQDSTFILSVR